MKFDKTEVFNIEGALRGMRNPKESWNKSDSYSITYDGKNADRYQGQIAGYHIGENDLKLAQTLLLAGSEHSKFMRMIHVCVDVNMPRYWWSEADTYGFNTKNSCSTMHRLLNNKNEITRDMFVMCEEDEDLVGYIVDRLEKMRVEFLSTQDYKLQTRLLVRAKRLLPEGFLQLRTFDTNYAELRNMYFQRRHHRLEEEWIGTFCGWIETLPYAKELIMLEVK